MKQTTLNLIKNINENTFIPANTKNELFELFQLDTVADLIKVSRNFMKIYELLEYFDNQTSNATSEKEGIVKFGMDSGSAVDAGTWRQAIGQMLGGYISKVRNKEAGKWYINDLTDGKIYKCIQNHTSASFDITKFVDITNVGLSDKLENLYTIETHVIFEHLTQAKVFKIGRLCILSMDSNDAWKGTTSGTVLFTLPENFRPLHYTVAPLAQLGTTESAAAQIETDGRVIYRGHQSIKGALYFNVTYLTK